MRTAALLAAVLLAMLAGAAWGEPAGADTSATAYALVTVPHGADAGRAVRAEGGRVVSRRLRIWRVPSSAVGRLRGRGAVTYSEPEQQRLRTDRTPTPDEHLGAEWWMPAVGADRVEPPGPGRPLTVIDSGLDVTHPDFAGRPDTELLNEQTIVNRSDFHGTAVASVAAAAANGVGLVGLYPTARLQAWDGSPRSVYTSADVIVGLEQAAARGPGIVNVSLGGPRSDQEARTVADVFARGTIVVAASGNDGERGSPASYPASLPHVVTVGATDADGRAASFSSRSRAMDVVAPGTDIPVALPLSLSESGYGTASGTSFSAPMVAAALAWAWTVRPDLEKTQLLELLRRAARDISPAGRDRATGFGMLDVPRLLETTAPTVDPFEPNDTVDQAEEAGRAPRYPLTTPARPRTRVAARLDVADDPRDVYGVWLPGRRRVTVTARTSGDVELGLLGDRPPALVVGRRRSAGSRTLVVTNNRARAAWIYVRVYTPAGASPTYASYTATITTAAATPR